MNAPIRDTYSLKWSQAPLVSEVRNNEKEEKEERERIIQEKKKKKKKKKKKNQRRENWENKIFLMN